MSTAVALVTPAQADTAAARLVAPAQVRTTPGALVSIPFPVDAVSGASTLRLVFTASGGASLNWLGSSALTDGVTPGVLRTEGSGGTVTVQGSAAALSAYLSAGGVKVGATGDGTVTVALQAGVSRAFATSQWPPRQRFRRRRSHRCSSCRARSASARRAARSSSPRAPCRAAAR